MNSFVSDGADGANDGDINTSSCAPEPRDHSLLSMDAYLWSKSLERHNIIQLILHLHSRIHFSPCITNKIASFLKLPKVKVITRRHNSRQPTYTFWNKREYPLGLCRQTSHSEFYMIARNFQCECVAFHCASQDGRHHIVEVISKHFRQVIMDVLEASVAFSYNGLDIAVPVVRSGTACIAVYPVEECADDHGSFLSNHREIFCPKQFAWVFGEDTAIPLAFSPDGEILAVAASGRVFWLDVNNETFAGWSRCYTDFEILALQYTPNGCFIAAAGNNMDSSNEILFNGFVRMFNSRGSLVWEMTSDDTGERMPTIDTLAFSSECANMACHQSYETQVYVVHIECGNAHRLTVDDAVHALIMSPSGDRLIVAHASSIIIIDTASATKLFQTPLHDAAFAIEAMSWRGKYNEDD